MVTPTLCCQTYKLTCIYPSWFHFPSCDKRRQGPLHKDKFLLRGERFYLLSHPQGSYYASSLLSWIFRKNVYIYILLSLVCKETTHTHTQRNHSFFWPWPLILTIHISSPSKQISWMGWLKLSFLLLHLPSAPILFLKNFHSVKAFEKASVLYQLHHHFAIKYFKRVFDA